MIPRPNFLPLKPNGRKIGKESLSRSPHPLRNFFTISVKSPLCCQLCKQRLPSMSNSMTAELHLLNFHEEKFKQYQEIMKKKFSKKY